MLFPFFNVEKQFKELNEKNSPKQNSPIIHEGSK